MKKWLVALSALFLAGARASELRAGFVQVLPSGEVRVYFPAGSHLEGRIFLQRPGPSGAAECCRVVDARSLAPVEAGESSVLDLGDPEQGPSAAYSLTQSTPASPPTGFVGIAVAAERVVAARPTRVRAASGAGTLDARVCFGAEGLHLIAKSNGAYRVLYMGLGYPIDQAPRCDERYLRIIGNQTP